MDVIVFVEEKEEAESFPIEQRMAIRQYLNNCLFELNRVPLKGESIEIAIAGHKFYATVTDDIYTRISVKGNGDCEEDYCIVVDVTWVDLNAYNVEND